MGACRTSPIPSCSERSGPTWRASPSTASRSAWGPVAAAALGRDDPVPALLELRPARADSGPAARRLFVLGGTIAVAEAALAFPRLGLDSALELGLVAVDGETVRAIVDLRPSAIADEHGVASWWIVSDLGELALGGELPDEHVLGAGAASSTLAGITVPADGGSVLDLGTGSGIQALHALRTASRVVGTDVSPARHPLRRPERGAERRRDRPAAGRPLRAGAGERFDRIVSNPPFVITPRGADGVPAYTYRDGGAVGDGLVAAVVSGAREHLAPGGIAQLLGNWEVRGDEAAARDRVLGWAEGLDVWVVQRDLLDPAEYAETWVRDGGAHPGTARWRALVRAWLDDFADRGVTAIGAGYLTLRAPGPGTAPMRRFEHLDAPLAGGVAEAIAAGLAAHDWQAARRDDALAGARLAVAPRCHGAPAPLARRGRPHRARCCARAPASRGCGGSTPSPPRSSAPATASSRSRTSCARSPASCRSTAPRRCTTCCRSSGSSWWRASSASRPDRGRPDRASRPSRPGR